MFQPIQDIIQSLSQGVLPSTIRHKGSLGKKLAQDLTVTAIATAGAGALTAAAIAGGIINRTGPGAGYEDTTATAAEIAALFPDAEIGDTFEFTIRNTVAFALTFTGGVGITEAGTVNITASKVRRYVGIFTAIDTPAITIWGIGESDL